MSESTRAPRWMKVLYGVAVATMAASTNVFAAWPHGCCAGSNSCGDTKVCCTKPEGWDVCYDGWINDIENYCNPGGCDLDGQEN